MNGLDRSDQPAPWLEVTAALLVPAAVVGFSRVFDSLDPLLPILAASVISTAIAIVGRRLGLPLVATAALSAVALGEILMHRYAPGTALAGIIPTGATFDELGLLFDELLLNFQELKSPVPGIDPFVAAAMVGAWIMAFLTDWGAMRLRLAFEPVLPSALLFIFTSIPPVSAGRHRVVSALAYGSAVALWAVAQRVGTIRDQGHWLNAHRRTGPASIARAGLALAALAVAAGTLIGPRLPGADDEPVYSFAEQSNSTREVISPYVKLYERLVDQSDTELFQVASNEPAYWRIAGLDEYKDEIWRLAGDFSREDGELPSTTALGGNRVEVVQTYDIEALGAIWLPAAYSPTEIVETSAEMTWHADTSSLTVDAKSPDGDGVIYTISSQVADVEPADLRNADPTIPVGVAEQYLPLPAMPPLLSETADEVTAGSTSRYDQMMDLQEYFRTEFDYEVELSNSMSDPITQFLTERKGFCQQFAGTFALMARHLGAPARVATGFTWGDKIGEAEDGRDIYRVSGAQAHAWPEIYFEGIGWVAFEPTPGRGIPGAAYTETTPAQASIDQPTLPEEPIEDQAAPSTSMLTDLTAPQPSFDEETPAPELTGAGSGFGIPWRLLGFVFLVGAYLLGMPLLRSYLRNRRRARAAASAERVQLAWTEASETLDFGFDRSRSPSETRTEYATRLAEEGAAGAGQMVELADLTTKARFHPPAVGPDEVRRADELAAGIDAAMKQHVGRFIRYRRELDPRRLPGLSTKATQGAEAGRFTTKKSAVAPSSDDAIVVDVEDAAFSDTEVTVR